MNTPPINRIVATPRTPEAQTRRAVTIPDTPLANRKRAREEAAPIENGITAQTTDAIAKGVLTETRPAKRNLRGDYALAANKEIYGSTRWKAGHCNPANPRFGNQDPGSQGGASSAIGV